jgi:hypothetical protein
VQAQLSLDINPDPAPSYVQRGANILQTIFKEHFPDFADSYEEKYAPTYGRFRLERITEVVENFMSCGDYTKGIARIQCTNSECKEEFFRPFSCKGFHLCPSCSQKRTLLFAEYMANDLLLRLPHRLVTLSLPKMLRVFFKHDRKLFSEVSRLIFDMVQDHLNEAAKTRVETAAVLCFQSFGEFLRWNSHFHGLFLEGGFDQNGNFVYIPFSNLSQMTECFRRRVIKLFLEKKLINQHMADNLLNWRHSGFSIDSSIRFFGGSQQERENLAQYIARPPISLKKIRFESFHGKILFHTSYNNYFKENLKLFDALEFIALLTQHLPPKGVQYIRRYGLYSSRSRGKWIEKPYVVRLAPDGWSQKHLDSSDSPETQEQYNPDFSVCSSESKAAWARLIAKVYEVNPLECAKCHSPMKILAVITDPEEVKKILRHLVKTGKSPPALDPSSLN